MKKVVIISLVFLGTLLIWGCNSFFKLADLRQEGYQYPNNTEKAQNLLKQMGKAHHIHLWDSLSTYQVIFEDEFYGFLGKQAHPFKEQQMKFALQYIPNTFNGRLEILSGKEKGNIWGMDDWQIYQKDEQGQIVAKDDKDMKFWIPTYQYFIEFPKRIQEASIIDYLGKKTIDGTPVEGIIASWNTVAPQKDIDQYIIWLDASTHKIFKIEYTVRDTYRFVAGAATFQDYKVYHGLPLPAALPVESNLKKEGLLHTMRIKDFQANPVSAEELSPLD